MGQNLKTGMSAKFMGCLGSGFPFSGLTSIFCHEGKEKKIHVCLGETQLLTYILATIAGDPLAPHTKARGFVNDWSQHCLRVWTRFHLDLVTQNPWVTLGSLRQFRVLAGWKVSQNSRAIRAMQNSFSSVKVLEEMQDTEMHRTK